SLTDILKEAFLWAVPKKKTTHSRSRMRQSNKALKDRHDIHTCPACGKNKLSHHICLYCYSELKQKYREFK
ncbi:zinc-binding ribosomal protein, partial [Dimargaris cristalligena]